MQEKDYTCPICDVEFTIIHDTGFEPTVCPFCESKLEEVEEDDTDDLFEDDEEWDG